MKESFFQVVSVAEFIRKLQSFPPTPRQHSVLQETFGMALAEEITADHDLPLVHRSCMDGYAVRAQDTFGATESNPAYLDLAFSVDIQELPTTPLEQGKCARITTGGCLPEEADAVVMVEHAMELGPDTIEIRKSLSPWDNVMIRGEDVTQGSIALPAGIRLDAAKIGLLAALGVSSVPVHAPVRVGLLSTGDEVVDVDQPVRPGLVRDVNSHTLAALAKVCGAEVICCGLVKDNLDALTQALEQRLRDCDVLLISGGSSVGTRDHTLEAAHKASGGRILAHGVAMSPGKPTILAAAGDKAILGLPGQVASAQVVMQILVMPFLAHLGGLRDAFALQPGSRLPARLIRNVASRQGRTDFVRVSLHLDQDRQLLASPVLGKSGLLKTLLQADGLMEIPENSEGLSAGASVLVRPLM